MPALETELARAIRRYIAGQDRAPGSTVPESLSNQATPVTSTAAGARAGSVMSGRARDYPDRDDDGPAFRHAANSFGFLWQDRATMKAYREVMITVPVAAGGTATIRPDAAVNWWIEASGNVTLAFGPTEDEPELVFDAEGKAVLHQTILVTVYLSRIAGATLTLPGGIRVSSDVRSSTGVDNPFSAAQSAGQVDVFTFQRVPNQGWFCYVAGRRMS